MFQIEYQLKFNYSLYIYLNGVKREKRINNEGEIILPLFLTYQILIIICQLSVYYRRNNSL